MGSQIHRSDAVGIRMVPIQDRSSKRVGDLLDAAAHLIEKTGILSLSTSSIAQSAGSSVGGFYRYFPNLQSIVDALANRNFERYLRRATAKPEGNEQVSESVYRRATDTYIRMCRDEPGFRRLRFGTEIFPRSISEPRVAEVIVANLVSSSIAPVKDEPPPRSTVTQLHNIIELGLAIIDRAFLENPDGNLFLIEMAHNLSRQFLGD